MGITVLDEGYPKRRAVVGSVDWSLKRARQTERSESAPRLTVLGLPGRKVTSLSLAKCSNPIFLLKN